MGVGLFYSANQSDSQDYCDAVKQRPGNHLEHPSTDHIDCHYKRPRWISLDHSVIEDWGWAHFTQTTNQTLWITGKAVKPRPSNHAEGKASLVLCCVLIIILLFRTNLTRYSSCNRLSQTHETGVKSCGLLRNGGLDMTFISDRGVRWSYSVRKSGEKSHRQCIAANFDES